MIISVMYLLNYWPKKLISPSHKLHFALQPHTRWFFNQNFPNLLFTCFFVESLNLVFQTVSEIWSDANHSDKAISVSCLSHLGHALVSVQNSVQQVARLWCKIVLSSHAFLNTQPLTLAFSKLFKKLLAAVPQQFWVIFNRRLPPSIVFGE